MSTLRLIGKIVLWLGAAFAALAAIGAMLFLVFIFTPAPEQPRLSGTFSRETLVIAGIRRTYTLYLPADFAAGGPLVVAMHGSDGSASRLRVETGYAFERLADRHGFALLYPNAFEGNWNACNIVGDYTANARNIDDVTFLTTLVDQIGESLGIDRSRVFAVGVSRGGHMAYRLALEAPNRFRAVAAVAANLPAPNNFKCEPHVGGMTSVMIMNGVRDPLNPFEGGEARLLGLYDRGSVRSAYESAQFFAALNSIRAAPTNAVLEEQEEVSRTIWAGDDVEVELVGVRNGGHSLPQPYRRAPRILGPTAMQLDGAAEIWGFFERQRPRAQDE